MPERICNFYFCNDRVDDFKSSEVCLTKLVNTAIRKNEIDENIVILMPKVSSYAAFRARQISVCECFCYFFSILCS